METVEFKYGPKAIHLYMSGEAMFRIEALNLEDQPDILDRMVKTTVDGTASLCQVAAILAESGELCRRHLGYSKERIPSAQELQQILTPMQLLSLRSAAIKAIDAGYASDEAGEDQGDIDLGLIELEKKTKL